MKTKLFLPLLAAFGILINSCEINERILPSGNITKEVKNFSGYNALDVSHAFTVYVNFSDTEESVEIEADHNLHPYISVRKISDVLYIGIRDNVHIRGNATLNVFITTKNIIDYTASGASSLIVHDIITANSASISLSGASSFNGKLNVNYADAEISGASDIRIEGSADTFDARASGASSIRDYGFILNDLNIRLSGASNAYLTVNHDLSVQASGASKLYYKGSGAIVDLNLSGASQIIRVD